VDKKFGGKRKRHNNEVTLDFDRAKPFKKHKAQFKKPKDD
jgi:hypothetical protein